MRSSYVTQSQALNGDHSQNVAKMQAQKKALSKLRSLKSLKTAGDGKIVLYVKGKERYLFPDSPRTKDACYELGILKKDLVQK